jgi:hypothetical protein
MLWSRRFAPYAIVANEPAGQLSGPLGRRHSQRLCDGGIQESKRALGCIRLIDDAALVEWRSERDQVGLVAGTWCGREDQEGWTKL